MLKWRFANPGGRGSGGEKLLLTRRLVHPGFVAPFFRVKTRASRPWRDEAQSEAPSPPPTVRDEAQSEALSPPPLTPPLQGEENRLRNHFLWHFPARLARARHARTGQVVSSDSL
jgi:hypothetical protein